MDILQQLREFVKSPQACFGRKKTWVVDETMSARIERSSHLLEGGTRLTIDIFEIEVEKPGHGTGMAFIKETHVLNPFWGTCIMNVTNARFAERLRKDQWMPIDGGEHPSFFKKT